MMVLGNFYEKMMVVCLVMYEGKFWERKRSWKFNPTMKLQHLQKFSLPLSRRFLFHLRQI